MLHVALTHPMRHQHSVLSLLKCTLLHDIDSDQICLTQFGFVCWHRHNYILYVMHACAVWVTSSFSLRVVLVYLGSFESPH